MPMSLVALLIGVLTVQDDILTEMVIPEDDFIGLDHADRSRTLRNGVGDLFLR